MSKVRLERLLNLTALLIETGRPLAAEEIQRRVAGYPRTEDAFKKAFERDKQDVRAMGIPLAMETIPHTSPAIEGYRIRRSDYYLDDPGLDAAELTALHLAASAVRTEGLGAQDGLIKLEGATGATEPENTLALVNRGGEQLAALPGQDGLGDLFGAVTGSERVRFTYNDTVREVDPYRLDFQRGHWYLTGFDHVRGERRVFRVDRITGQVTVLPGVSFERPADVPPPAEPWEFGGGDPVLAQVAIDADQAPWALGALGEDAVTERRDDGSVLMEVPVKSEENFRSFVLTFLEHAEVLGPPKLRAEIVAWLEGLGR